MSDINVGDRVRVVRGGAVARAGDVGVLVEIDGGDTRMPYRVVIGDHGDHTLRCAGVERIEPRPDPVAELRAEVARLADRVTALESDELRRKKIKGTGSQ